MTAADHANTVREARAYIEEHGPPGTGIETTEESAARSADLLHRLRRDPISDTTFRDRWYKRTLRAAEVRYLNPHQTRHTYGHRLREFGFDLEERKVLMGHESIRTTEHYYGRVTVEDVAAKIAGTTGL